MRKTASIGTTKADRFDSHLEPEAIGRIGPSACASVTNRSQRGPGRLEIWLRGRATSGTCSCGAELRSDRRLTSAKHLI